VAGFWELRRAVELNERILIAMGGSKIAAPHLSPGWEDTLDLDAQRKEARALIDEVFGNRPAWGWKDPRNSFTLPFWRKELPELRCVICLRNPLDVAESGSLAAIPRHELDRTEAFELWGRYMASAIVNTSGWPRMIVSYEGYFADRQSTVDHLARFAGLNPPTEAHEDGTIGSLIDGRLRHHLSSVDEALEAEDMPTSTRLLYQALWDSLHSTVEPSAVEIEDSADDALDRLALRMLTHEPGTVAGPRTLPGTTGYVTTAPGPPPPTTSGGSSSNYS